MAVGGPPAPGYPASTRRVPLTARPLAADRPADGIEMSKLRDGVSCLIKIGSNQARRVLVSSPVDVPPSCPPERQMTLTGVPVAAIPRALASASPSGNKESCWPCDSRVGAVIRFKIDFGLDAASSASIWASGTPVWAACWYAAHRSGANRPQAS